MNTEHIIECDSCFTCETVDEYQSTNQCPGCGTTKPIRDDIIKHLETTQRNGAEDADITKTPDYSGEVHFIHVAVDGFVLLKYSRTHSYEMNVGGKGGAQEFNLGGGLKTRSRKK